MRERTPFTAALFARLPRLKLLITSGMRNASIDLDAAREHGVTVCGTGSAKTPPTELTWALILGLARHLVVENAAFHDGGPWQSTVGADLSGRTLGLLGFGHLGKAVARVGKAFGMDVVAWSPNLTADRVEPEGVRLAGGLHDLLARSDFASIHLVLSDRTRGLVDADALACLKPTAFLVNTSRAAIVDSVALLEVLRERRIAGAGLDVFEVEPLPLTDELRTLPNVLATPHLGYVTEANYRTYFTEAVENIHAFRAGEPIRKL
jgi:phosphoglycerate dehydrogenase-like enzyme